MFTKIVSLVIPIILAITTAIGFIYDSVYLEEFGVGYYELIGSPTHYISIGGIYLLHTYAGNLKLIIIVLGLIGIFYKPLTQKISKHHLERFIDTDSLPYILIASSPIILMAIIPIIQDAQQAATEATTYASDRICITGQATCYDGVILRYRENKIIFYNSESKKTDVYLEKNLISSHHQKI